MQILIALSTKNAPPCSHASNELVVDTNVFVSAALMESSWSAMVVRWLDKYDGLLKSIVTEQELFEVLQRPRIASKIAPSFFDNLRTLFAAAELVSMTQRITGCRDPKDNKFLELAVSDHADVIVSGDADLLVLDAFQGISIINPAAFTHARVMRP
jgi:putative PIN family toxin of toxin-antitoxin system